MRFAHSCGRSFTACLILFGIVSTAGAQTPASRDSIRDDARFTFYDRGPYRPNVPRPETILGYDVGTFNTQFALQEKTLLAIADAAKDRVRIEEIGATNERRIMRLYIISAPENLQRLDAIRADLNRIADPRGAAQAELDAIVARVPAVVWINESVHGNESPGFETAMQTLYHFAASEEPATVAALRNTLIILNPSTNPDGHERFTVWYNSINVNSPEPSSLEKDEPWSIQGRFNHYRFDMNRDVMTSTQREVQALVRAQVRWHPMVAVDQHGQVGTYFFPPTAPALNPNLGTDFVRWMEIYGKANAAAFDRHGWMYYSRDIYDFYGPFYWDSWPSLSGAIGMTYETDGGGWKGHRWRREDGTIVTLRDGIAKHFTTALATVFTTADRRAERVRDYLAFRQRAIMDGRTDAMKRVVLVPGEDPARTAELVTALLRTGIEVRRINVPLMTGRAHAYADDVVAAKRFEAGAYIVDLAQPEGKMAKAFLDPKPPLDTTFARIQNDKYKRNVRRGANEAREGYEFYDVTAWSMPVTYGVEAYWTEDAPAVTGELLTAPPNDPIVRDPAREARRVSGEVLAVDIASGIVSGRPAGSAYLFSPERNGASRLAFHLLQENYRVAVTTTTVEAGGRTWPRGTYVVRVARNDSTIHARLDVLARQSGVEVVGVNSAATDTKQYGIGSENVVALVPPKVALVGDDGISQTGYGAIWYTLERRYGIAFTPISLGVLSSGDLTGYNVIILPDASGGALNQRLGKPGADRLREWVRAGGTLITMGGATGWAAREDVNLTSARAVAATRDTASKSGAAATLDSVTAAVRAREKTPDRVQSDLLAVTSPTASADDPAPLPGTHFDVTLDRTHWLTHGFERPRLTVMLDGGRFLKLSKEGTNVAVFPSSGPLLRAGFVFNDNTERLLRGTALLIDEPTGAGHVVLFNNEPMFRAWWRSLDRLVLNAVVLGPAM